MSGMRIADVINPIVNFGRTISVNNFELINPVNIYNKLKSPPTIQSIIAASTTAPPKGTIEGVDETQQSQTEDISKQDINIGSLIFLSISLIISLCAISFVINDMIMHPWLVRLIMAIVLFIISILNPLTPFIVMIYYFINAMWKYYINTTLPESEQKRIIPYIYGFLPLSTWKPVSILGKIIMTPFSYSPEIDGNNLVWDRKEWLKSLLGSFHDPKLTLQIGGMETLYSQYKDSLSKIHEYELITKKGDKDEIILANPFNPPSSQSITQPLEESVSQPELDQPKTKLN